MYILNTLSTTKKCPLKNLKTLYLKTVTDELDLLKKIFIIQ